VAPAAVDAPTIAVEFPISIPYDDAFNVSKVNLFENVGFNDRTTEPVPVDVETPVPPFTTGIIPVIFVDAIEPLNVVAFTTPATYKPVLQRVASLTPPVVKPITSVPRWYIPVFESPFQEYPGNNTESLPINSWLLALIMTSLLNVVIPVTPSVFDNVVAPEAPRVVTEVPARVVAPVTDIVPELDRPARVVAPVTLRVFERVEAPLTFNVFDREVAPDAPRVVTEVPARVVAPVTFNVFERVEAPLTFNVFDKEVAPDAPRVVTEVPARDVAPVTDIVPELDRPARVVAPVTFRVFERVEAPLTFNVFDREVAPDAPRVVTEVPDRVVAPFTFKVDVIFAVPVTSREY
jgi:hypothetical protein